jgi:hypothetical protein
MTLRALAAVATAPAVLAVVSSCAPAPAAVAVGQDIPSFEVDPKWPPIMPNRWIIGEVRGMHVDARG